MLKVKSNLIFLIAFAMLFSACNTYLQYAKNVRLSHALLQEVVKAYDYQPDSTPIFVAPVFQHRTEIFPKQYFSDEKANYGEILKEEAKELQFPIHLPENPKSRVRLYDGKSDLTKSKSTYLFCSPLLKTKERRIYFMQVFVVYTLIDDDIEVRFAERYFNKYRLTGGKLVLLDTIHSPEDFLTP